MAGSAKTPPGLREFRGAELAGTQPLHPPAPPFRLGDVHKDIATPVRNNHGYNASPTHADGHKPPFQTGSKAAIFTPSQGGTHGMAGR